MKCIRYYRAHGGHVTRVTDAEAEIAVRAGHALYAPKHWLRAALKREAMEREDAISD